jgi:hypothetical protein
MPRQTALVAENNFVRGLITETTAIKFPENACTETFNCVFDETGRVTRRLGIDLEDNYSLTVVAEEEGEVFSEFLWQAVGGDGAKNFFVQQQGSTLRFYDLSDSIDVSDNLKSFTVDLNSYIPDGGAIDPATVPCQYTTHDGNLLVASGGMEPIYVVYNAISDTIAATAIEIKIRDFTGVDDGLDVTERITSDVTSLQTNNPEHYYNLLNQGWYHGSTGTAGGDTGATLAQWDTARTDMPSNADTVGLYRSSATDAFDNAAVLANSPGNRPAPKGHFIMRVTYQDRDAAALAEGFTVTLGVIPSFISAATGTIIGNFDTASMANAFDDDTSESKGLGVNFAFKDDATSGYIGKTVSAFPKQINRAIVYGTTNQGFATTPNVAGTSGDYTGSMTFTLYGKVGAAPATATDGTSLGTVVFNDGADESGGRTISSSDQDTFFDHVWVTFARTDGVAQSFSVVEVRFYTNGSEGSAVPSTTNRPTCITSFAGRVFYAGINDLGLNSSIFFTRIVEKPVQYQECYQTNDPTSADFFDLLPDDGGVIKIPEIGKVIRLFPYQSSLLILATNGVWRVSGGSGSFAANDYKVNKLSSIGTDAALSLVDYKGLPIWWTEDGICTIQYDANYDSFAVVSITDNSIKSFILSIPETNRKYIKGAFDINNDIIYWLYNADDSPLALENYYRYDRALCMNGVSKAFYPWVFSDGEPDIRGICYVADGAREKTPRIKYTVTVDDGATEVLTFAEISSDTYTDWATGYTPANYDSHFVTGYRLDASGVRFFQTNYVWVFMEEEEDASCFMQGVWDWTTSSSTGKWSTLQQIYNNTLTTRLMRFRRLKVRGKGRALQLRFESETGKPFTIVGWAYKGSANADV